MMGLYPQGTTFCPSLAFKGPQQLMHLQDQGFAPLSAVLCGPHPLLVSALLTLRVHQRSTPALGQQIPSLPPLPAPGCVSCSLCSRVTPPHASSSPGRTSAGNSVPGLSPRAAREDAGWDFFLSRGAAGLWHPNNPSAREACMVPGHSMDRAGY